MGAKLNIARLAPPPPRFEDRGDADGDRISGVYPIGDHFVMADNGRNLFVSNPLPDHIVNRFFVTSATDERAPEFIAGSRYTDYLAAIASWRRTVDINDLMEAIRSIVKAADESAKIMVTGNNSDVLMRALLKSRVSLYSRGMELCDEATAQIFESPVVNNLLMSQVTRTDAHCERQIADITKKLSFNDGSGGNVAPGGALPPAATNDGGMVALPEYSDDEVDADAALAIAEDVQCDQAATSAMVALSAAALFAV